MIRILSFAMFALLLTGCVPIARDEAREEFGVSTGRAEAGAASLGQADRAGLERKTGQICVRGYREIRTEVEPAESNRQIVDMKLACGHYDRIHFDPSRVDWSNVL